jgi:hypothetical protein
LGGYFPLRGNLRHGFRSLAVHGCTESDRVMGNNHPSGVSDEVQGAQSVLSKASKTRSPKPAAQNIPKPSLACSYKLTADSFFQTANECAIISNSALLVLICSINGSTSSLLIFKCSKTIESKVWRLFGNRPCSSSRWFAR